MEDILEFDPATEFQVLETFEFEELIQRPEQLRLFTLEEQLLDYFDVRLPKGKLTKFQLNEFSTEVDRTREAYLQSVQPTETLYDVRQKRTARMPSWIHPMFDSFSLGSYPYKSAWVPLFSEEQRKLPQAYPRMILAMPKPYQTIASENPPITKTTIGRKEDETTEIRGLGPYERTRTMLHEDGSRDIVGVPIASSQDDLRIKGYVLERRELELPNPLAGHPFLQSTDVGKVITKEPFEDIYPTVDAILTHAVPTTNQPYTEGLKYLKLYDVRYDEIPWASWKSRFPPVDSVMEPTPVKSVSFPTPDMTSKPSDNLLGVYGKTWSPGIHPRHWLMTQEDGGLMVERMLLSKASEAGNVPVEMVGEMIERSFPQTTPEECVPTNTFQSFLESGVSRARIIENKKEFEKIEYACVPVAIIQQERREAITRGRIAWKESMEQDILRVHQTLLQKAQPVPRVEKIEKYEAVAPKEESQIRKDILTLMKDPRRTPEDKAEAIDVLLRDVIPTEKKLFLDVNETFLVCSHTLAILKGDLERDPTEFYREWTAVDLGVRVCKSCGEQISATFVAQDEFDNDGRLVVSQAVLDRPTYQGDAQIDSFANSLKDLKKVFEMDHAGEVTMYILLSLLQVLPTESQLLPVLQFVRDVSKALRGQKKKVATDTVNRIDGIVGLAGTVILLQTHQPFLVPRRSFGSKPLVLTGYPRDTQDANQKGILDTLMFVLKTTFEAFPGTFSGPIVPFIRSVVSKTVDTRKESLLYIKTAAAKFKAQVESAKERYVMPEQTTNMNMTFPAIPLEKSAYKPGETLPQQTVVSVCSAVKPGAILLSKKGPIVSQKPLPVWEDLELSSTAKIVQEPAGYDMELATFKADDVRKRLAIGFPKSLKQLTVLKNYLTEEKDGISLLNVLSRLLDILATEPTFSQKVVTALKNIVVQIDTKISASLLRDTMLGFLYSLLEAVANSPNVSGLEKRIAFEVKTDVVLRMLMIRRDEAQKKEQGLRARERETLKQRLRSMNDAEREITKQLMDIGIGTIITKADRELFSKEFEVKEEADTLAQGIVDENRPEEGYNDGRDYVDDEPPITGNGVEMNVDNGDYGDMAVRDYEDYTGQNQYDDGDNYGV
jgi:hypothetical protein